LFFSYTLGVIWHKPMPFMPSLSI